MKNVYFSGLSYNPEMINHFRVMTGYDAEEIKVFTNIDSNCSYLKQGPETPLATIMIPLEEFSNTQIL